MKSAIYIKFNVIWFDLQHLSGLISVNIELMECFHNKVILQ